MRVTSSAALAAFAITLLTITVASSTAAAQEEMTVEQLEAAAGEAYGQGDYKKAIQFMIRANQIEPHPNYLLNIAVSYSKNGDCENARLWAQNAKSSTSPALPAEGIKTAESVIQGCEEIADPDENNITNPNNGEGNGGKTDEEPKGLGWRPLTAYSLLGVGGVTTIAAIIFDASVNSDIDRLTNDQGSFANKAEFDAFKTDTESSQGLVPVIYVTGVVLIAAGGGLLAWDILDTSKGDAAGEPAPSTEPAGSPAEAAPPEPTTSVSPFFTGEAGGVMLQGTF